MEIYEAPLKLNIGNRWPSHLHDKKIYGLDINTEYCCAAVAGQPSDGVIPMELDSLFYHPDSGDYFSRIPTVLALDEEDPSRGWIGFEGEACAAEEGRTLYRNFLMVPDQRADQHYQNDPTQPTYRKLMDIFFYELLQELSGGLLFLALPDDEDWRNQRDFYEDLLREVSRRWNADNPEPDYYVQFFLLDLSGAREAYRLNEPKGTADDPYALCKGLAACGVLLQQREVLLDKTREMLEEAFPWSWARFRDVLYMDMRKLFCPTLEKALSNWSKNSESMLSFRKLIEGLSVDIKSIASDQQEQLESSINRASLLIVEDIPTTGSDPMDDPDAFSGFPPTYLGPKAYFPNQLHHRMLNRTQFDFVDNLSWLNWEELKIFYFRWFMNSEEYCQAIKPFVKSFRSYIPSESAMLGPVYSKTLSVLGHLGRQSLDPVMKGYIYQTTVDRKEQIEKDMQWKIYLDVQSWDLLSRSFFQAIYNRQVEVLNHCLSFITTPTSPEPPEEGVLI